MTKSNSKNKKNLKANAGNLEREIDERAFDLYGLNEEEIKIIEGNLILKIL